jgi:DNA polymerase I
MLIKPPELSLIRKGWLPNMRMLVSVDPGMVGIDMDLDRADLQVVVWEADDDDLRLALRSGIDMHLFNAAAIFNIRGIPTDEMVATHPNYEDHKKRYNAQRNKAKIGVHATNYGAYDKTVAEQLGITRHEASNFRERWFTAHPGIKKWHLRTARQLAENRTVTNKFGYRRVYFDRPDLLLTQALAWVPQSTVAIVIDHAMDNIVTHLSERVEILLQVHDSLYMQTAANTLDEILPLIERASLIEIPYDTPLTIPVGFEVTKTNWGECKKYKSQQTPTS